MSYRSRFPLILSQEKELKMGRQGRARAGETGDQSAQAAGAQGR